MIDRPTKIKYYTNPSKRTKIKRTQIQQKTGLNRINGFVENLYFYHISQKNFYF